jgi:hypothetical protein
MNKLIPVVLIALAGCTAVSETPSETPQATVHHIVLCWLKEPGNAEHRRRIMDASLTFRDIPGVLDVRVGEVIESDRPIVDDSYDVAIMVSFAGTEKMGEYLVHPIHEKAKKEVLLPVVERIVVYDFREPADGH